MQSLHFIRQWTRGPAFASLAAALLFGASAPLAKLLLGQADPWLLAALLYLGSGLGLLLLRRLWRAQPVRLPADAWPWLAAAVVAGGVVAPVLLMRGLAAMPASAASLLLNAEAVFTALVAWIVFRENVARRIALGLAAIVSGGLVLAWPGVVRDWHWQPVACVLAACLAWALDNNFTRKVSLVDASWLAMAKGLVAGATNLVLALALGAAWPAAPVVLAAALLGFASYGASLALFVVGLRGLGSARAGAYFSVAPFFGAVLAVGLFAEPVTPQLLAAGALMALGVLLHLAERHQHEHVHEPLEHSHAHVHGVGDAHHAHLHQPPLPAGTRHSHAHVHQPLRHTHPHFPDAHHRHGHRH